MLHGANVKTSLQSFSGANLIPLDYVHSLTCKVLFKTQTTLSHCLEEIFVVKLKLEFKFYFLVWRQS